MKHRLHTQGSINILPGQPGWRTFLKAFPPGKERDAIREEGYQKLKEIEEAREARNNSSRPSSGLAGGPQ